MHSVLQAYMFLIIASYANYKLVMKHVCHCYPQMLNFRLEDVRIFTQSQGLKETAGFVQNDMTSVELRL